MRQVKFARYTISKGRSACLRLREISKKRKDCLSTPMHTTIKDIARLRVMPSAADKIFFEIPLE